VRNYRVIGAFCLVLSAGVVTLPVVYAQSNGNEPEAGERIYTQNAPDKLPKADRLPADLHSGYHLTQAKCAECHTLKRTFDKTNLSQDEWADIVYRMQDMASSHLDTQQSEAILKYLVWNDQHQQKAGKP
jgi:mono/diheme cytochrome c family protein